MASITGVSQVLGTHLGLAQDFQRYSPYPRFCYCGALTVNDRPQERLLECSIARKLALADPWSREKVSIIEKRMKDIAVHFDLPLPAGLE